MSSDERRAARLRHALTRIARFPLRRKHTQALDMQYPVDLPDQRLRSQHGVEARVCYFSHIAIAASRVPVFRHQQGRHFAAALCDEPGDGAFRTGEAVAKDDQVHMFSIEQPGNLP